MGELAGAPALESILGHCQGFWSWMGHKAGWDRQAAWAAGGGAGVGEGVSPFLVSSPSREGRRGCSHPGPSATSTASVGGAIHLTAPP